MAVAWAMGRRWGKGALGSTGLRFGLGTSAVWSWIPLGLPVALRPESWRALSRFPPSGVLRNVLPRFPGEVKFAPIGRPLSSSSLPRYEVGDQRDATWRPTVLLLT